MSSFSFTVDFYDEVEEDVEIVDIKPENTIKCEFCNLKVEENDIATHICFTIDQTIIQEEKIELDSDGDRNSFSLSLKSEEGKLFQCKKCDYKSKHKTNLKRHDIFKHQNPDEIEWFKCENCDFKSKGKSDLNRHVIFRHANPKKNECFQCEKCNYKCKKKINLESHNICKHINLDEVDWFKCENCDYKSKIKGNLKSHITQKHGHPNPSRVWFKCGKCDFKCNLEKDLDRHAAMKHVNPEDIKWIKCEQCGYKCILERDLKAHTSFKHIIPSPTTISSEVVFKCEKCEFNCKWLWGLELHKTGCNSKPNVKKRFSRDKCDVNDNLNNRRVYSKNDNLNRRVYSNYHSRAIAKPEAKPNNEWFQCNKCDFKCKTSGELKRHEIDKLRYFQKINWKEMLKQSTTCK